MWTRKSPEGGGPLKRSKRRRRDENGEPGTLKRGLQPWLKEGSSSTDVVLVVTKDDGDVRLLPAHKKILVAMSPVMGSKIRKSQSWGQERDIVEIPSHFSVGAVEEFLKFVYTKELEQDLSIKIWLELIFLADNYKVHDLLHLSDDKLIDRINFGNCINFYEKTRRLQDAECSTFAFKLIQTSLAEILGNFPNEWLVMEASTWKTILELNYLPNVEEIDLFNALKRWADFNLDERASDFQELVKLIRYALIGVEKFTNLVFPYPDLDAELEKLWVYFGGKETVAESERFGYCQQRNLLEPKNSQELKKFIRESQSGDIIELKGTFSSFVIQRNKENLTIRGKEGEEAIIKTADEFGIEIYGQACKIHQLTIISKMSKNQSFTTAGIFVNEPAAKTKLKNIKITGGHHGLVIRGSESTIENISIIDTTVSGLLIEESSWKNKISNCSIIINNKNLESDKDFCHGFVIKGAGHNYLSNLRSQNTRCNTLGSKGNFVDGFEISGGWFQIATGGNTCGNVNVIGEKWEDSAINFFPKIEKVKLNNCRAQNFFVNGNYHRVKNSKGMEFRVDGKGNKCENCEAELLLLSPRAELKSTKCNYNVIKRR